MSSHVNDQALVKQLVDEHPDKIVPAFGLHPWWSHHVSFEDADCLPSKLEHYRKVFPASFTATDTLTDEETTLLQSFPEPTSFSTFVSQVLRPNLEAYPQAMLGEVGLDRSFRIPLPQTDAKSNRSDQRIVKKFTNLKVPVEHQMKLLQEQMEIAFELNRNISFHCVQAHGLVADLLVALPKQSKHWKNSNSMICLHSFGGSVDVIQRITKHIEKERVYLSFSTTINARLDRLEELIRAVPDNRLLIESDYNHIEHNEARIWEILGIVCEAKSWKPQEAAEQLEKNWDTFSGETH
jgi:Tat protein secretion system quality control protein TatD with DNase activity